MNRYTIDDFNQDFPNDDACLHELFEIRFGETKICQECNKETRFNRVKNRRSYHCEKCGFQIYPTAGTVFEKTTIPLIYWFRAIFMQTTTRNGVAAKELERTFNICYKTALRMSHQLKILMGKHLSVLNSDVTMIDEAVVGGLLQNKTKTQRKNIHFTYGNSWKSYNKTIVLGMVQDNGTILAKIIGSITENEIIPLILKNVKFGTTIVTDGHSVYSTLTDYGYKHIVVRHDLGEYSAGKYSTNKIEGYWSHLKRTIRGTHIQVSKRHLQKYVDEVSFRYQNRNNQKDMFRTILRNVV